MAPSAFGADQKRAGKITLRTILPAHKVWHLTLDALVWFVAMCLKLWQLEAMMRWMNLNRWKTSNLHNGPQDLECQAWHCVLRRFRTGDALEESKMSKRAKMTGSLQPQGLVASILVDKVDWKRSMNQRLKKKLVRKKTSRNRFLLVS
jgi:hypothetical protein